MRIREFYIKRYGPLQDKHYMLSDGFNLLFGKNEDGKTLTIDALLKLLLGKNVKNFKAIHRVDENPEGYVIVEDGNGRRVKVPENGLLSAIVDMTPLECRDIFVIRNSDLSIPLESDFYMHLTDRLVGLRTEEISRIRESLREIAKITPGGLYRDLRDEKLRTRIEQAERCMGEIESLTEEIQVARFDELEEQAVSCREEIDGLRKEMEDLEDARKREQYEKGLAALESLKASLQRLEEMKDYSGHDELLWRDCTRDVQRLEGEKKTVEQEVARQKVDARKLDEEIAQKQAEFDVLDEARNRIDNEIRQAVIAYKKHRERLEGKSIARETVAVTWKICAVFLALSLLGLIARPTTEFLFLVGFFLAVTVTLWATEFHLVRYRGRLARDFKGIQLALAGFGLDAVDLEEILSKVRRFDMEYEMKSAGLQDLKRNRAVVRSKLEELADRKIPEFGARIREAEEQIQRIRSRSRENSLEVYSQKLRDKGELEKSIAEQESVLRSHFGAIDDSLERELEYWGKEIALLEKYRERGAGIQYSENASAALEEKRRRIQATLDSTQDKMIRLQTRMREMERKANEILRVDGEYFHCNTSIDLEAIWHRLGAFVKAHEKERGHVLLALRLFEEIEQEEKQKVSALFDADSPISGYFADITGGLYEEVSFNQETGEVEVRRGDGTLLSAEKLSGGTYDQLYLSVRLTLGEKFLKGQKGFFIMDDPLVKADPERLRRQSKVLTTTSSRGWQIMYFSAKEEIEAAMREEIERRLIHRIPIQGMLS